MQTLLADEEAKTGLDFLADLWSGRINNTLLSFNNQLSALMAEIQTIKENIAMKTQAEQALLDAADLLTSTESEFRSVIGGMQSKIDQLVAQAQSPTATAAPEDLTEELGTFNERLNSMRSYAESLKSQASTVSTGDASGTAGQASPQPAPTSEASPIAPNPVMPDPETGVVPVLESNTPGSNLPPVAVDPASPTPLAGETGIANTPTDNQANPIEVGEGEVFANQVQPGTDPSTTQPAVSSTGTGTSEDPTATAPQTTNDSASEIPGNAASNTEVGVGGVTPGETSSPSDVETRNAPTESQAQEGANTVSSSTADSTASDSPQTPIGEETSGTSGIIDESIK